MQDKEFDTVFQQKFADFKVEPSQTSRDNIFNIVGENREHKRSYQPYWAVAATIAVIVSFGTWFANSDEKVRLSGKAKESEPIEEQRAVIPQTVLAGEELTETATIEDRVNPAPNRKQNREVEYEVYNQAPVELMTYEDLNPPEVKFPEEEQTVAKNLQEKAGSFAPETPQPVLVMEDNDVEQEILAMKAVAKNYNTVGDLVNFVIGKVDKRKNKIIEFTDTDEGSMISGINLGLVRFKSRSKGN